MEVTSYLILLIAIGFGVIGQILLKRGMQGKENTQAKDLFAQVINPYVLSGFLCYGFSTLLYFVAIAKLDLSLAYPTVSLGYVAVVYLSKLFLKEEFSAWRWVAIAMICVGVVLVGFGGV
jgi:multidrug transporter EmrE-like cation transporter